MKNNKKINYFIGNKQYILFIFINNNFYILRYKNIYIITLYYVWLDILIIR